MSEAGIVAARTTGVAGVFGVVEPDPPAAAPSGPSRPSIVWYFFCRDIAYVRTEISSQFYTNENTTTNSSICFQQKVKTVRNKRLPNVNKFVLQHWNAYAVF